MSATNIIPFNQKGLPAHIAARMAQIDVSANDALGVSFSGPPRISTEGKRFTIVANGKETIINDPRTDEPAQSIQVVILRANPGDNKAYYAEGYQKGVAAGPLCFSNDGIKPDPQSRDPQAKSCAMCPHNRFGSAMRDGVPGKGKACGDSKHIAIATPDRLDQPMLLRVPPTSLKNLRLYGKFLREKGVTFQLVATKIGFDPQVTHQQLVFTPAGFLDDVTVDEVFAMQDDDLVKQITGEKRATQADEDEIEEAPAPVVAKAKPRPAPAPVKQDIAEEDEEEEDVEAAPEPAPAPAPKPKAKIRQDAAPAPKADEDSDMEDEIGSFLGGGFDDD